MNRHYLSTLSVLLAATFVGGCATKPGQPKVSVSAPQGAANPVKAPSKIYVTDIYLSPDMIQSAPTLREKVGLGSGPLSHIRSEADTLRGDDPANKAKKIIRTLGEAIAGKLQKSGYPAEYKPSIEGLRKDFFPTNAVLPTDGWLLGGWFERLEEPNRAEEATVGFGAGSGHVAVQILVSDLTGDPRQPFLFIGSENGEKRMPGGVVSKNPYVMAAKFVMSRGETERDVKKMGAAIADSVVKYIQHPDASASAK